MSTTPRNINGWTLIELLVGMSVIIILLVLVVPSWQQLIQKKSLDSAQQTLHDAINYARVLALVKHQTLTLCSPQNNWADGFRLTAGKAHEICSLSKPLRQWAFKSPGSLIISWHGFNKDEKLVFYPQSSQWAVNGRFTLSVANRQTMNVIVNRLGRAFVE